MKLSEIIRELELSSAAASTRARATKSGCRSATRGRRYGAYS